jgi:hypothetical protein
MALASKIDSTKYDEKRAAKERLRRTIKINFVFRAYLVAGIFIAIGSSVYALFKVIDITITEEIRIPLMLALTGILMSFISFFAMNFYRYFDALNPNSDNIERLGFRLVEEWMRFERTARNLIALNKYFDDPQKNRVPSKTNMARNVMGLRDVLENLLEIEAISGEDYHILEHILGFRNSIVHGIDEDRISADDLDFSIEVLKGITVQMRDYISLKG